MALQQQTRTVPIVFVGVIDPVGAGLVTSLAHPGGNTTGFTVFEYGLSPKLAGTAQGDRAYADSSFVMAGGLTSYRPNRH